MKKELTISHCSCCGNCHKLTFTPFRNPNGRDTHWSTCPETGEPIIMEIQDKMEELRESLADICESIRNYETRYFMAFKNAFPEGAEIIVNTSKLYRLKAWNNEKVIVTAVKRLTSDKDVRIFAKCPRTGEEDAFRQSEVVEIL